MNVHLLKSDELSLDLYWDVFNLLSEFKGPVNYIHTEDFPKFEDEELKRRTIKTEKDFYKKSYLQIVKNREFPLKRKESTWGGIFAKCKSYRRKHDIGDDEYVVLLTDIANDRNWFMAIDNNLRNSFIHTADWDYYIDSDYKYPIAFLVVEMILQTHMADSVPDIIKLYHKHPLGCVNDFDLNKKDIALKLRTADICIDCQRVIKSRKVPPPLVNQILSTMEGIRKQMLFKERFKYHLQPAPMLFNLVQRKAQLVDMPSMTVRFTPLEATIYYFFLQHEEGLALNEMYRYENELFNIYAKCSVANSDNNIAAMKDSINILVDPLENSLNEKISKIKSKFIKVLGKDVAAFYYILKDTETGNYKVDIDRSLVEIIK